jgi:hypothetical protein
LSDSLNMALGMNAWTTSYHNTQGRARQAAWVECTSATRHESFSTTNLIPWRESETNAHWKAITRKCENKSKKAIAKRSYLTASFLIRMDCRQDVSSLEFVETALNIFATSCHVLQIPIGEISHVGTISLELSNGRWEAGTNRHALQPRPQIASTTRGLRRAKPHGT